MTSDEGKRLQALRGLLLSLFDADKFRIFIHDFMGPEFLDEIPAKAQPTDVLVFETVLLMRRIGAVNIRLFTSLVSLAPARGYEIALVARHWGFNNIVELATLTAVLDDICEALIRSDVSTAVKLIVDNASEFFHSPLESHRTLLVRRIGESSPQLGCFTIRSRDLPRASSIHEDKLGQWDLNNDDHPTDIDIYKILPIDTPVVEFAESIPGVVAGKSASSVAEVISRDNFLGLSDMYGRLIPPRQTPIFQRPDAAPRGRRRTAADHRRVRTHIYVGDRRRFSAEEKHRWDQIKQSAWKLSLDLATLQSLVALLVREGLRGRVAVSLTSPIRRFCDDSDVS